APGPRPGPQRHATPCEGRVGEKPAGAVRVLGAEHRREDVLPGPARQGTPGAGREARQSARSGDGDPRAGQPDHPRHRPQGPPIRQADDPCQDPGSAGAYVRGNGCLAPEASPIYGGKVKHPVGWEITANRKTYTLDFSGHPELEKLASQLVNKTVVVSGTLKD